jgi:hypothetical protein
MNRSLTAAILVLAAAVLVLALVIVSHDTGGRFPGQGCIQRVEGVEPWPPSTWPYALPPCGR